MVNIKESVVESETQDKYANGNKHLVHWFRRGLRLHDQPALIEGLKNATTFRCVYLIDKWFASVSNRGNNKWLFLIQTLEDLDSSLRKLNSRLFIIRGQPSDVFPKLFKEWNTTHLSFETEPEPYGKLRDTHITQMCHQLGVRVIDNCSHTLYSLEQILIKSGGTLKNFAHFQSIISSMGAPLPPKPRITLQTIDKAISPIDDDHDMKYGIPTLEELGFDSSLMVSPTPWIGGETQAILSLERHLQQKAWIAVFGIPRLRQQSLFGTTNTGLSPYLRFGCLSARLFYQELSNIYKKLKKTYPPLSLYGQLLWREFFYCLSTNNFNYDTMIGNPNCLQIAWDKKPDLLDKWANAQTGFPYIDAIQTQIIQEGWVHPVARHATICFLTRGGLWISWEEGMKIFDELLLDADSSINAGIWMWHSSSYTFQQTPFFYCAINFGQKIDTNGDYIRKYVSALRHYPQKYIHEPWKAPIEVQESANCIIGRDYPLPIIDHLEASQTNYEKMNNIFNKSKGLAKYRGKMTKSKGYTKGFTNGYRISVN